MNKILTEKLHTTELGAERIKKNICLDTNDVVNWCREKIKKSNSHITRKGKNWYVKIDDCVITVNAYSYTIITAHKIKCHVPAKTDRLYGSETGIVIV